MTFAQTQNINLADYNIPILPLLLLAVCMFPLSLCFAGSNSARRFKWNPCGRTL